MGNAIGLAANRSRHYSESARIAAGEFADAGSIRPFRGLIVPESTVLRGRERRVVEV